MFLLVGTTKCLVDLDQKFHFSHAPFFSYLFFFFFSNMIPTYKKSEVKLFYQLFVLETSFLIRVLSIYIYKYVIIAFYVIVLCPEIAPP